MSEQYFFEGPTSRKEKNIKWKTRVEKKVFSGQSKYQKIEIFDTYEFGRMLVLDGLIQLAKKDEPIYHEMLVQPAMFYHPNPKRVLIVGGGDGGSLREVLKHKTVKEVILDDIDEKVIEVSKKYLPFVSKGAFNDKRTKIAIEDGLKYIKNFKNYFDVIIMDATDPRPRDIAIGLFQKPFLKDAYKAMAKDGIISIQSGWVVENFSKMTRKNIKAIFPHMKLHRAFVPCFPFEEHTFTSGSKKIDLNKVAYQKIKKRFKKRRIKTKYYTPEIHLASSIIPNTWKV